MNERDDAMPDRLPQSLFRDAPCDPRLADALRRREPARSPHDDETLRIRIVRAAGPLLARLRERPRAWWEWTATWAQTVLPLGIAASLLAAVVLVREIRSTEGTDDGVTQHIAQTTTTTRSTKTLLLNVATGATNVAEIGDAVVARPSDDWLYARVMNDDERMGP